jgi:prostaglandin-endoperoxide synthase 2
MINSVILIKLVIEAYINHIAEFDLFRLDTTGFAEKEDWYRTQWLAGGFDLLYRWHSLVPDQLKIADQRLGRDQFLYNNALLEGVGLAELFKSASKQAAGQLD